MNTLLKNILLFLFLSVTVFYISCWWIAIWLMTFGIWLIITVPWIILIIYHILKLIFWKEYMWKFLTELTLIFIPIILLIVFFNFSWIKTGTLAERDIIDSILFFILVLIFLFTSFRFDKYRELFLMLQNNKWKGSQQALDLISSLSQINISNITSITFIPTTWKGFIIKTPNIKKLAIYITTKLGKTTFKEEELRKAFDHVVTNISSDLSKTDFDLIQGKISEFVRSGGEVKIERI